VPIGVAAKGIDGSWRVKLFSDRGAIDYVRVMLFEDFGQLMVRTILNAPPLAALGTLPEATGAQSAAIADAAARRDAAAASAPNVECRHSSARPPPRPGPASGAPAFGRHVRPPRRRPNRDAAGNPPEGPNETPRRGPRRRTGAVDRLPAAHHGSATIVLATPVELFGLNLPEPVIPMVLAFAWPLIRPSVIAPLVLMGVGLGLDIFTWGALLGMWALALLAVYAVVLASRSRSDRSGHGRCCSSGTPPAAGWPS
jgi:hypothetical protein